MVLSIICHIWKIVPDLSEAIRKIQESRRGQEDFYHQTTVSLGSNSSVAAHEPSPVTAYLSGDVSSTEAAYAKSGADATGLDSGDYQELWNETVKMEAYNYCLHKIHQAGNIFNFTQPPLPDSSSTLQPPMPQPTQQNVSFVLTFKNLCRY